MFAAGCLSWLFVVRCILLLFDVCCCCPLCVARCLLLLLVIVSVRGCCLPLLLAVNVYDLLLLFGVVRSLRAVACR